ncbi:MAG: hypothetical protein WDN72_05575 [Alphaproteobacteria bacterium]
MILSTKGRYAVMAMVDLAAQKAPGPVTLAAIAGPAGDPRPPTSNRYSPS